MTNAAFDQINLDGTVYNVSQIFYNGTVFNSTACTATTCSLLIGEYTYLPNAPANHFFAVVFALLFLINLPLGLYYRTWGFSIGMLFGLGLEIGAYVFRLLIHDNDFNRNLFVTYLYCVTLGPAFLSAAIYLCLARIVIVYGEDNSRLSPRSYSICFVIGDLLALSLQGAGGGMAVVPEVSDMGVDVMIAGLSFQVLSLIVFVLVCVDFAWRVRRGVGSPNPVFASLRSQGRWHCFLAALAIATTAIVIRSAYRVAELQAGFHSSLANNEPLLMVFEGGVMTVACVVLTVFHPGLVFRQQWRSADFRFCGGPRRKAERAGSF